MEGLAPALCGGEFVKQLLIGAGEQRLNCVAGFHGETAEFGSGGEVEDSLFRGGHPALT